jgi:hypothetical protein
MADAPTYLDGAGEYVAPTASIEDRTLIFDRANNRQVMWLAGTHSLPPGTFIELFDAERGIHGEAVVERMRVLASAGRVPATLCADVAVTHWWEAQLGEDALEQTVVELHPLDGPERNGFASA